MIDKVKNFIEKQELLAPEDPVLVAVSGGVDSMVLAHVLKKLDYKLSVAHMNFQLRGQDSDDDENFVAHWCGQHNVPFFTRKVHQKDQESVQLWARNERYQWFEQLREKESFTCLATAHHLDDSLETVLYNLTKGTGISGLIGIPIRNGWIVRPLMACTKAEIEVFAQAEGVFWREDSSNAEDKYLRNKLRNQVIPVLTEINPALTDTFGQTLERIRDVKEVFGRRVEEIKAQHLKAESEQFYLDLRWLETEPGAATLLFEILKPYDLPFEQVKQLINAETTGKVVQNEAYLFNKDRGGLWVVPQTTQQEIWIDKPGNFRWQSYEVMVEEVEDEGCVITDSENTAVLDAEKVQFPICLRSWKEGDAFRPLGMKGKKKLSDFMIDAKIPLSLKNKVPIFETKGAICWVGGHQIDDRFKWTEDTKKVLRIKLLQGD